MLPLKLRDEDYLGAACCYEGYQGAVRGEGGYGGGCSIRGQFAAVGEGGGLGFSEVAAREVQGRDFW
jgi:hypothetical protein